jgi:hypothetical protein
MRPHTDQEWEELPHVLLTEDANWDPTYMDHEQGDDPAWYEQQDDPPLLNSDFDLCGDYRHRIVYKSNLTSNMYTPTGRILVHENDVFFNTPGDEAFVDAHSNKHDDTDVDIEVATDRCVFQANAHRYVCSANADSDADTCPSHFMTYKILTDDTHQIIHRSNICSAADPNARNLRLDPLNDKLPKVIQSLRKASPASDHGEDFSLHSMEPTNENPKCPSTGDDTVIDNPQELLGRTFLMDTQEDGQRFRARIVECISDHESNVRRSDDHVKFRLSINEDEYEEIITYNELMDFIEKNQENDAIVWQF